jgi:pimeloyl-ACP methyl ester carboxylesterase
VKISLVPAFIVAHVLAVGCATASRGEYTMHWSRAKDIATVPIASGLTLRYVSVGHGPPLVLLHTIRTQLDYFERVIPALTDHYRVYVLDLPGHGQSTILKTQYTEPLFRQAVREYVTQLDLRGVTLVGESIGGVLALTVAAEVPDRISRVVAINPYDYGEKYGGGVRRGNAGWIIGLFHVFGRLTVEPKGLLRKVFESGFSDRSKLPEPIFTEFYRTGRRSGYRRAEASVWKNWRTWVEAKALYPRVAVPVTLAYSSGDWSTAEDRERTYRAIPSAERLAIDDAGHFASLEDPQAVVRVILANSGCRRGELSRGPLSRAERRFFMDGQSRDLLSRQLMVTLDIVSPRSAGRSQDPTVARGQHR